VSVRVQLTAPVDARVGELQDAVKPGGKPESTLALAPTAPAGTVTPPTGTAVTVSAAVPADCMLRVDLDTWISTAGAYCTCAATALVTVRPSPLADTVNLAEPTGAAALAVSVKVTVVGPVEASVAGLVDHEALRLLGRPEMLKAMGPLKEPPPVKVKTSVTDVPWTTGIWVDAGETSSVGGLRSTVSVIPWLAE